MHVEFVSLLLECMHEFFAILLGCLCNVHVFQCVLVFYTFFSSTYLTHINSRLWVKEFWGPQVLGVRWSQKICLIRATVSRDKRKFPQVDQADNNFTLVYRNKLVYEIPVQVSIKRVLNKPQCDVKKTPSSE